MTYRMMTRSLIAAVAVTMLPAVAGAQSWNQSQVFNIQGTNPLVCNLAVGAAAAVDLSTAARGTTQNIATVGVTCNQSSGFTASYASANASVLKNGSFGLAYQAQVTSSDAQFGFALKTLTTNATDTVDNYPSLAMSGVSGTFSVVTSTAVVGGHTPVLPVGTYTDTVSVTLAANP